MLTLRNALVLLSTIHLDFCCVIHGNGGLSCETTWWCIVVSGFGLLSTLVSTAGFATSILVCMYFLNSSWWFRGYIAGIAIVVMVGERRHHFMLRVHQTMRKNSTHFQEKDSSWTSRKIPSWVPGAKSQCCCVRVGASFLTDIDLALLFVQLDSPCQSCSTGDSEVCGSVVKSPVLQLSSSWRERDDNVFWLCAYSLCPIKKTPR